MFFYIRNVCTLARVVFGVFSILFLFVSSYGAAAEEPIDEQLLFDDIVEGFGFDDVQKFLEMKGRRIERRLKEHHDPNNMTHWYEMDCCSLSDCKHYTSDEWFPTAGGYMVFFDTGYSESEAPRWVFVPQELVRPRPKEAESTPDIFWHFCIQESWWDLNLTPICAYPPDTVS